MTANLTDAAVPVEGAVVSVLVTAGPNSMDAGTDDTDAAGDAMFTYTGNDFPGLDAITAWLDINGNGTPDAGEPSDVVAKLWNGVTGTIDLTDVDGGGVVVGDLLQVTVDDRDLDVSEAPDTIDVLVVSDSDDGGFLLTLTETGDHTGVFQGIVELGDATDAGSNVLQAASGAVVTATYDDALDGEGNPAAVTATLDVGDTEEEGLKVTLCHVPGGNPANQHTITVGSSAVKTHLANHGDTIGECGEYDGPTKRFEQLSSFCDRNPDHSRCDELDGAAAGSANVEVGDGDTEDGQLADFCERKADHPRCADGGSAGQARTAVFSRATPRAMRSWLPSGSASRTTRAARG